MAVYTDISDEDLRDFLVDYDLGALESYNGVAEGVENSNFIVRTGSGPCILTLYEKRVDPDDLPFFLGLMEHLAARGVPCPTPLKTRDGRALRRLAGRPAAMVSFLPGVWPRRPTATQCGAVGVALARLHLAAADFTLTRRNALDLYGWSPLAAQTAGGADRVHHGLAAAIAEELEALTVSWPQDLPTGIIHADLFPDNVFFQRENLSGVIDFYFACRDFLAYDLAICINAWCFDPDGRTLDVTRARALFSGYDAVRPLSAAERAMFPLLCRGAALRFLLTRLYDWLNQIPGALVTPKNPLDYLHRLRFHQGAGDLAAYGLS